MIGVAFSRPPVRAFVALGANLGDAVTAVRQALAALDGLPATRVLMQSSLYRSSPVQACGPDFINAVAALETCLDPHALLARLQALERDAGRERPYPNAPRTLDLDLLLYGAASVDSPWLSVPHPRMTQRAFVLRPLAEIAPEQVDPLALQAVAGQSIAVL